MEINLENKTIILASVSYSVDELAIALAKKNTHAVADIIKNKIESLPRSLRIRALRSVLNKYVEIAKELKFADEIYYRLSFYSEYSEYQLENFYNQVLESNRNLVNEKDLTLTYKSNFYKLLLCSWNDIGLEDADLEAILNFNNTNDNFKEFNEILNPLFYDQKGAIDGLLYDDFRRVLGASATLNELRDIGTKFDIDIPRRLKKEELVEIILTNLKKQGQYDEAVEDKINKMSILPLQRFAKENGIKASTELKKDEVIEYLLTKVETNDVIKQSAKELDIKYIGEIEDFEFKIEYVKDIIEKPAAAEVQPQIIQSGLTEEQITTLIIRQVSQIIDQKLPQVLQKEENTIMTEIKEMEVEVIKEEVSEAVIEEVVEAIKEELPIEKKEPVEEVNQEDNVIHTIISRREVPQKEDLLKPLNNSEVKTIITRSERESEVLLANERLLKLLEDTNSRLRYLEDQIEYQKVPQKETNPVNITIKYADKIAEEEKAIVRETYEEEPKTIIIRKNEEPKIEPVIYNETAPIYEEEQHFVAPAMEVDDNEIVLNTIKVDTNSANLNEFEKLKLIAKNKSDLKKDDMSKEEFKNLLKNEKLEMQKEKLEKVKAANDKAILKRRRRRRIKRIIIWTIVLLLLLVITYSVLAVGVYRGRLILAANDNFLVFKADSPIALFFKDLETKMPFMKEPMKWIESIYNAVAKLFGAKPEILS